MVATSVTYFGYVGVLTGVRKGLSLSLNFRPEHDGSTWWKETRFGLHQLAVLFGFRRSIASVLRECLMPARKKDWGKSPSEIAAGLAREKSTAAYLIFCDGKETVVMEKDNGSAKVKRSEEFIVAVNHDFEDDAVPGASQEIAAENAEKLGMAGMLELVGDSMDRWKSVCRLWEAVNNTSDSERGNVRWVTKDTVLGWLTKGHEITNITTHYGVIMDPKEGQILWLRQYL